MIFRIGLGLLASSLFLAAQTGTKSLRDDRGRCTAAVPATASLALPYIAKGPGGSLLAILEWENDEFKVLSPAEVKEMKYAQVLENTSKRQILENDKSKVTPGTRVFHVYAPAPGGRCHVSITIKAPETEATMRQIAASLAPLK